MSDIAWKRLQTGLEILGLIVFALLCARLVGLVNAEYRDALANSFAAIVVAILFVRFVRHKEQRASYVSYALWAAAISVPMMTLAILRDAWTNHYFQAVLFPAVFAPVMIATVLGYFVLAFLVFRSVRRSG